MSKPRIRHIRGKSGQIVATIATIDVIENSDDRNLDVIAVGVARRNRSDEAVKRVGTNLAISRAVRVATHLGLSTKETEAGLGFVITRAELVRFIKSDQIWRGRFSFNLNNIMDVIKA